MSDTSDTVVEQPFISHLLELRDRLLKMILAVLVFFIGMFPFANEIYIFVAEPLMAHLPEGTSMIATQVASPFLTPFKLSLVGSVFLAMPYILFQFWSFIAPGLYQHERKKVIPLVVSSIILFYTGMIFSYFVVFPLVFGFLTGTVPDGVAVMTDITSYLDFVLTLFFAFGIAFEVPIATIVLVMMGVTTPDKLRKQRPFIIVGAFVLGMFLTPPDVISQTLLALPMWLLFEVGVFFSAGFVKKEDSDSETDDEDTQEPQMPENNIDPDVKPASVSSAQTNETKEKETDAAESEIMKYPEDFSPMSEEEMDAELDQLEDDDEDDHHSSDDGSEFFDDNAVDLKLIQVMEYRDENNIKAARALLYEVLEEGDDSQIKVARNILVQLDSDESDD